jgi:hypothetical protein
MHTVIVSVFHKLLYALAVTEEPSATAVLVMK